MNVKITVGEIRDAVKPLDGKQYRTREALDDAIQPTFGSLQAVFPGKSFRDFTDILINKGWIAYSPSHGFSIKLPSVGPDTPLDYPLQGSVETPVQAPVETPMRDPMENPLPVEIPQREWSEGDPPSRPITGLATAPAIKEQQLNSRELHILLSLDADPEVINTLRQKGLIRDDHLSPAGQVLIDKWLKKYGA